MAKTPENRENQEMNAPARRWEAAQEVLARRAEREALGPVMPVPREQSDALSTAPGQQPEAVVLDLVNPASAGRWPLDGLRQARLNEIRE
jgi:hypothetical protein